MPLWQSQMGIRKLSQLEIDTDKDWLGHIIKNLGAPVDANDAIRKTDLDSHASSTTAHVPSGKYVAYTSRSDQAPSWDDIPDKPSAFPPEAHASSHAKGGSDELDLSGYVGSGLSWDSANKVIYIGSRQVKRSMLEYPTVDVTIAYLLAIEKARAVRIKPSSADKRGWAVVTTDSFTDKAIWGYAVAEAGVIARWQNTNNFYNLVIAVGTSGKDFNLRIFSGGSESSIGYEAVNLSGSEVYDIKLSVSGSSFTAYREGASKFTATNSSIASGGYGADRRRIDKEGHCIWIASRMLAPSSPSTPALYIIETETSENGYLMLSKEVEIDKIINAPSHLKLEAKKYMMLKAKGFTDDEIKSLLGYIPQYTTDVEAVTSASFEFNREAPYCLVTIFDDNPYKAGAILRQIEYAKKRGWNVFPAPKDYISAITLYKRLKSDHPEWLAGKDNFAYQVLGWEELELFQVADFYYGELIEHKTHYNQIKRVPDWELERTVKMWLERLKKVKILLTERDKHIRKLEEVLKRGW